MRAIVTGMVATYPVGGVVWDYLQYALGLEALGWEVYYLEDTGWQTYDPRTGTYGGDPSFGVTFLRGSLRALSPSLGSRWHFRAMDGTSKGIPRDEFARIAADADVFLNVSGGTLLRDEYMKSRCKVLIDTDPGFNHFVNFPKWDKNPGWYGSHGYRAHDFFFTYAEALGTAPCTLPALGLEWHSTRPPVLLDRWQARPPGSAWTTVMTWDNFREAIENNGTTYGTKEREFVRIEGLPHKIDPKLGIQLEVAVGGEPPADRWRHLGWSVIDAQTVSLTCDTYHNYVQQSRGEFSVAKNVYVDTHSGWFSCRSVCYLAAGLPVVVQDTGFSDVIPTGEGLLAFSDAEQAADALECVEKEYARHAKAARAVAAEYFEAGRVLTDILHTIGLD